MVQGAITEKIFTDDVQLIPPVSQRSGGSDGRWPNHITKVNQRHASQNVVFLNLLHFQR